MTDSTQLFFGRTLSLSVVMRFGTHPCSFNNFPINFNAALAFRLDCTRKSRTSPYCRRHAITNDDALE